ncbi:hypothetical protein BB14905_02520 [Bacillus sp. B14905]|nr:hypothetical protein BB14905_02520 [Bacillus sp. B14905]
MLTILDLRTIKALSVIINIMVIFRYFLIVSTMDFSGERAKIVCKVTKIEGVLVMKNCFYTYLSKVSIKRQAGKHELF